MTSAKTSGIVFWITGLPGAGKSTIADEVERLARARTPAVVRLDGDLVREVMEHDLGYDLAARLRNARRISRLCRMLSVQGLHVVCSTVSLFRECHEWNRVHIDRYCEIYVKVSLETLHQRDQKGLFSAAVEGREEHVIGVTQSFDEPRDAHLVIENEPGAGTPESMAARIIVAAEERHGPLR